MPVSSNGDIPKGGNEDITVSPHTVSDPGLHSRKALFYERVSEPLRMRKRWITHLENDLADSEKLRRKSVQATV